MGTNSGGSGRRGCIPISPSGRRVHTHIYPGCAHTHTQDLEVGAEALIGRSGRSAGAGAWRTTAPPPSAAVAMRRMRRRTRTGVLVLGVLVLALVLAFALVLLHLLLESGEPCHASAGSSEGVAQARCCCRQPQIALGKPWRSPRALLRFCPRLSHLEATIQILSGVCLPHSVRRRA